MPSFQETFIDRESISEWAYMNKDLYGRVLERVFDTIMTFQHVEKIERMKRGASPWLLRFLSGYIQTIGPAGTGPCIGDLLKSHWAKHGCKRAADTNAAPSAPIDPSSMSSNKANAVEAPRRSHEPAVQPLPSKFHSTGHSDDCLRDLGRRIEKEFVEVLQQMSSATYTNSCPLHTPTLDDANPTILGQGISGFPAMRTFIRDPVPETPLPILEKPVLSPSSVSEPGKSTALANQAYAAKNPFTSKGCRKGARETKGAGGQGGTDGIKGAKGAKGAKGTMGQEWQLEPRDFAP